MPMNLNRLRGFRRDHLLGLKQMQNGRPDDVFQPRHVVDLNRHGKHRLALGVLCRVAPDDAVGIESQVGRLGETVPDYSAARGRCDESRWCPWIEYRSQ